MTTSTVPHYEPRLQAAIDAALAKYPTQQDRIAKAADLVARDYVVPPTADDPTWRVGPARWQVQSACPGQCECEDWKYRRQPCKHLFSVWLYRKMQQAPPVRTLQFYATLAGVGGVATVYETGQAFFQEDGAAQSRQCTDEEIVYHLVLGGRVDICHAA